MNERIVITGVGLTAPNGNNLSEFRESLLNQVSGIQHVERRYLGRVAAGVCNFDEFKYQHKKIRRRGTRAGSIAIYCANEAVSDSAIDFDSVDKSRVGVYIGITEHGNVETDDELHELLKNDKQTEFWSHHHNSRTVANVPAGEVSLNLDITGPSYTVGAACAAGNIGIIQGVQMLQLGEVDLALVGGVSESCNSFGIFASFKSQNALGEHDDPTKACKPLDKNRNGIVVSEGGAVFTLERLSSAQERGAKIYGEIVGHHINSDATDFVLPNAERQQECINKALKKAGLEPSEIDLVSMHATGTPSGDIIETKAVRNVFNNSEETYINATKGFIGHTMGAAGILELAGNLPSFEDNRIHSCKYIEDVDPQCDLKNLVNGEPVEKEVHTILNNSFGMLGINSVVIVKKFNKGA